MQLEWNNDGSMFNESKFDSQRNLQQGMAINMEFNDVNQRFGIWYPLEIDYVHDATSGKVQLIEKSLISFDSWLTLHYPFQLKLNELLYNYST